jgi:MFS family permease
MMQQLTG